jgi:hypothetical protein
MLKSEKHMQKEDCVSRFLFMGDGAGALQAKRELEGLRIPPEYLHISSSWRAGGFLSNLQVHHITASPV